MITEKVIDSLYQQYRKRPNCIDDLNIMLLFENLIDSHGIVIEDASDLIINSIEKDSPFHKIPLKNIHAIIEFERQIAIVLHSSIVFLYKENSDCYIHLKAPKRSLLHKIINR